MGPSKLPDNILPKLDDIYRRRWETLLAVDEMVLAIHNALKLRNVLNNTNIVFTSDHGYHIGKEFKKLLYSLNLSPFNIIRINSFIWESLLIFFSRAVWIAIG